MRALKAVTEPILIRERRATQMTHSRTQLVGHLFHSVIWEKKSENGRPLSREKAQIRRETEQTQPNSIIENTRMIPTIAAVTALVLLVKASKKTPMIGYPVGVERTVSASVMAYKIAMM